MPKDTDDMEDIIKLLTDLLLNANISKEYIKTKLNEFHYCINCMQHFNRCHCDMDEDNDAINNSSDTDSNKSYNYTSSEGIESDNE